LCNGVYQRTTGIDPIKNVNGADKPWVPWTECNTVDLDAADDDTNTEPKRAEKERLLWMEEGVFRVCRVKQRSKQHTRTQTDEKNEVEEENNQADCIQS
jgi:hypothetical protein